MAGIFSLFRGKQSCEVHFEGGPSVEVPGGTTILEAAQQAEVELDQVCGGSCSCSTCKVLVLEGAKSLSAMADDERSILNEKMSREGYRLSCQAKVKGTVRVRVPEYF